MARTGYERTLTLQVLGQVRTFKGVQEPVLEQIADAFSSRIVIDDGEALCNEGDAAESWWVILDGTARVVVGGTQVGAAGQNETVGELALFDEQAKHGATVSADGRLEALEFHKEHFLDIVRSSPDLALTLLREAARRLKATDALVCAPASAGG